jgi:hypothetical protein
MRIGSLVGSRFTLAPARAATVGVDGSRLEVTTDADVQSTAICGDLVLERFAESLTDIF